MTTEVVSWGPPLAQVLGGSMYRHRKSGRYCIVLAIGKIEATLNPCVIYQATYGSRDVWVRPLDEFMDGRFADME